MKLFLITLSLIFSLKSFASEDFDGHCDAHLKIMDLKALKVQDCSFAKQIVDNKEVKNYHREKSYEKLAEVLAKNIEQSFEEIALLDQFYSNRPGQDLMMKSQEIKDECKIQKITEKENTCTGKKLDLLKSQFKSEGSNLYRKLSSKFAKTRNLGNIDTKQCPINGTSGAFTLESQLNNSSALKFINNMKLENSSSNKSKDVHNAWFDSYPLFKLVIKTKQPAFIEKFNSYVTNFKGTSDTAEAYISDFFLKPENQKILSTGLANQCTNMSKSVSTFLCNQIELDNLASIEETPSKGMYGLDPEDKIFEQSKLVKDDKAYMAFGLKCLADDPKKKELINKAPDSVDKWYTKFAENMRPDVNTEKAIEKSESFCEYYSCKDKDVKEKDSCKNGGPLSNADLKAAFKCPNGEDCTEEIKKYITFLETFEAEIKKNKSFASISIENNSISEKRHKNSSFVDNFLGVEGSLFAAGKPITTENVAQKTTEFVERKLDPTPVTTEAKKLAPPTQATAAIAPVKNVAEQQVAQAPTRLAASQDFQDNYDTPALSAKKVRVPRAKVSEEGDSSRYASSDKDRNEIRDMKDQIDRMRASMANDQKPTPAATVAEATPVAAYPTSQGSKIEAFRNDKQRYEQPQDPNNGSRPTNWQAASDSAGAESKTQASAADSSASKRSDSPEAAAKGKKDSILSQAGADKAKAQKDGVAASGTVPGDAPTTEVTSEDLANLELGTLKKLGINSKSIFHIKIHDKQNKKVYDVVVRPDAVKGYLVPVIDDKNKPVSKLILASPLFKEFVESPQFKDYKYN